MLHARADYQRFQDPLEKEDRGKGIPKMEPVFLLRANDKLFVPMLKTYVMLAKLAGCDQKLIQAVVAHIETAKLWNLSHPAKTPDL
jgi:hypothetical protein